MTSAAAHLLMRRRYPVADPFLLPTITCLTGLGLIALERLAPTFLMKQLLWCSIGMVALTVVVRFSRNLRWLRRYRYLWLLLGFFLLGLTFLFGVNPLGGSARLWLGLRGLYFQPSEFLKLAFVVFLASYLAEKQELIRITYWRLSGLPLPPLAYLTPLLIVWGLTLLLLVAQQDLGAGALIFSTFLAMFYVTSRRILYVMGGVTLFILTGALGYLLSPFIALRINVWLDHGANPTLPAIRSSRPCYRSRQAGHSAQALVTASARATSLSFIRTSYSQRSQRSSVSSERLR